MGKFNCRDSPLGIFNCESMRISLPNRKQLFRTILPDRMKSALKVFRTIILKAPSSPPPPKKKSCKRQISHRTGISSSGKISTYISYTASIHDLLPLCTMVAAEPPFKKKCYQARRPTCPYVRRD